MSAGAAGGLRHDDVQVELTAAAAAEAMAPGDEAGNTAVWRTGPTAAAGAEVVGSAEDVALI